MSRPSVASVPSRLVLAGAFVLGVLTACESSKTAEQSAPPSDAPTTAESSAPSVSPPLAPPKSTEQDTSPPPVAPTEPTPATTPKAPSPPPEPRVPKKEAPLAMADVEAPPGEGGTLTGRVTFKGTPPAPKTFALDRFPNSKFCGKTDTDGLGNRVVQEVNVGEDHALRDVVVYFENVENGKPFTFDGTDVKAEGCEFLVQGGPSTMTSVVMKKKEIRVLNMDADPDDPKAATGVLHGHRSGSGLAFIHSLGYPSPH